MKFLAAAGITGVPEKLKSATALNLIRPNAEKVSILVRGTEDNPTIVDGGLYVGGNSASLRENVAGSSSGDQTHIKIGSYAIIDNVFLGNNGENMIRTNEAVSVVITKVCCAHLHAPILQAGTKRNSTPWIWKTRMSLPNTWKAAP